MLGVGSRGPCGDEGLVRARRGLQRACEQAGDRDDRLVRLTAPLRASAGPADVALVDLDHAVEQTARRAHRAPQLVQHRPRRLIRAEPEQTLQIERADTALLAGYEPDGAQPHPER